MQDVRSPKTTTQYLLSTAARSMSDVEGVDSATEELDGTRAAWLVVEVDGMLTSP